MDYKVTLGSAENGKELVWSVRTNPHACPGKVVPEKATSCVSSSRSFRGRGFDASYATVPTTFHLH